MLPYEITIEIAAMNRPLEDDELLKAAVKGDAAWKVDKDCFVPPVGFLCALSRKLYDDEWLRRAEFTAGTPYSVVKAEFWTPDANNLLDIFASASKAAMTAYGIGGRYLAECDYDYGGKFCQTFRCAAKITVTDNGAGRIQCTYYAPDTKTENAEGPKAKSLEEFLREWNAGK